MAAVKRTHSNQFRLSQYLLISNTHLKWCSVTWDSSRMSGHSWRHRGWSRCHLHPVKESTNFTSQSKHAHQQHPWFQTWISLNHLTPKKWGGKKKRGGSSSVTEFRPPPTDSLRFSIMVPQLSQHHFFMQTMLCSRLNCQCESPLKLVYRCESAQWWTGMPSRVYSHLGSVPDPLWPWPGWSTYQRLMNEWVWRKGL